ncbi:MAG: phosphoribosylformylglycinamidine synthase I [Planctomycetota bacterium]
MSTTTTRPKALVLRGPGTNCEDETLRALRMGGAEADLVRSDVAAREPGRLEGYGVLVFAGGFSYGDDLAAGRVWGAGLRQHLGRALRAHVDRGGLVLGVCNGFQVLVESGVFEPDAAPHERSVALFANASGHYECRWVTLEVQASRCGWLADGALAGTRFPCPVAHGEGRFAVADEAALARLREAGQIALTYVDDGAEAGQPAGYPANPNGATGDVAGICDPTGRVLGLMPHPERNLDPWNHPTWTRRGPGRSEGEGLAFYRALVESAASAC